MVELGFRPFDADNHYYEARDALTRPSTRRWRSGACRVGRGQRQEAPAGGGEINKFIPNPTFDPIAGPAAAEDYFRGRNDDGLDLKTMFGELDPLDRHPGSATATPASRCSTSRAWRGPCCSRRSESVCRRL